MCYAPTVHIDMQYKNIEEITECQHKMILTFLLILILSFTRSFLIIKVAGYFKYNLAWTGLLSFLGGVSGLGFGRE